MADKDFVVKNGLVVNTNLIVANGTSNRVGINNSSPDASLTVTGTANISGNVVVGGDLSVTGNISFAATTYENIIPVGNTYTLGDATNRWVVYANNIFASGNAAVTGQLTVGSTFTVNTVQFTVTGNSSFDGNTLFIDSENNRLGVNTSTPSVTLDIAANDAIMLPVGNTSQRPSPVEGMLRYNSDNDTFEGYANGSWKDIGGAIAYFKGNQGTIGTADAKGNLYRINANTQTANVTIEAGENAMVTGPVVIQSGYNLTIQEGGRAVIV